MRPLEHPTCEAFPQGIADAIWEVDSTTGTRIPVIVGSASTVT